MYGDGDDLQVDFDGLPRHSGVLPYLLCFRLAPSVEVGQLHGGWQIEWSNLDAGIIFETIKYLVRGIREAQCLGQRRGWDDQLFLRG